MIFRLVSVAGDLYVFSGLTFKSLLHDLNGDALAYNAVQIYKAILRRELVNTVRRTMTSSIGALLLPKRSASSLRKGSLSTSKPYWR